MQNLVIRKAAKEHGVRLWQIAERLGVNDGNFSRRLRRELPEQETIRILEIIKSLSEGGEQSAEAASSQR